MPLATLLLASLCVGPNRLRAAAMLLASCIFLTSWSLVHVFPPASQLAILVAKSLVCKAVVRCDPLIAN